MTDHKVIQDDYDMALCPKPLTYMSCTIACILLSSLVFGAVEAERLEAEERKRREEEEAHNKNLARMAEEQRQAAERQAIERKKQKLQEEQALLKGKAKRNSRESDSDSDLEDIPTHSGIMCLAVALCAVVGPRLSDLSNQLAGRQEPPAPAEPAASDPTPPPPVAEVVTEAAEVPPDVPPPVAPVKAGSQAV